MDAKETNTVYDWGQMPPTAPSIKRASPLSWMCASAIAGVVAGLIAMAVSWRSFPGLPAPLGTLPAHLGMWLEMLARHFVHGVFAADAKVYGEFWARISESDRIAIIWRVAFGALASLMPAVLLFRSYMTPRDSLIHLRGAMRHEGSKAVSLLRSKLARSAKLRPDHEIAPGLIYPAGMWERHVLVIGGSGSGKSTALKPLIEKVIAAKERVILFDPKGEFTMGFKGPAIVAAWDKRSFAWDIARDLRNIGDMRRFAAAMIQDSQDPMWANASRQLLVGFVIYLKRTRGNRWGWRELSELVAMPQATMLAVMNKYHPEAVRAVERASVTTQGILINLSSFCASIFDLADAWGDLPESKRISFVEWTLGKSRQSQIVLQGHGSYSELSKGYVQGIVEVIAAIVNSVEMEDDPNRKLWIICDEFPQMGKVPIRPLLEVGRSRGVRCVLACQDLAQLEEIHGERMVKAMVSLSGTLLIGRIMQGETAEQVAKALGTREVERPNLSSSYGGTGGSANRSTTLSFSRDELPIYKPSELASRLGPTPDEKGVIMALVTDGHAYELFWPRYQIKRARFSYVPAAWTLDVGRDGGGTSDAAPTGALGTPEHAGPIVAAQSDLAAFVAVDVLTPDPGEVWDVQGVAANPPPPSSTDVVGATSDGGPPASEVVVVSGENGAAARALDSSTSRLSDGELPAAFIGEELIGQMLRDSLEVVAEERPPTAPMGMPGAGLAPEASDSLCPMEMALVESAIAAGGGHALAMAVKVIDAASLASDPRPGPIQSVRVVQRAPVGAQPSGLKHTKGSAVGQEQK